MEPEKQFYHSPVIMMPAPHMSHDRHVTLGYHSPVIMMPARQDTDWLHVTMLHTCHMIDTWYNVTTHL